MFFLTIKFGDPLQFIRSQQVWTTLNPLGYIADTILRSLSWKFFFNTSVSLRYVSFTTNSSS
jgi:hypothetical protein